MRAEAPPRRRAQHARTRDRGGGVPNPITLALSLTLILSLTSWRARGPKASFSRSRFDPPSAAPLGGRSRSFPPSARRAALRA